MNLIESSWAMIFPLLVFGALLTLKVSLGCSVLPGRSVGWLIGAGLFYLVFSGGAGVFAEEIPFGGLIGLLSQTDFLTTMASLQTLLALSMIQVGLRIIQDGCLEGKYRKWLPFGTLLPCPLTMMTLMVAIGLGLNRMAGFSGLTVGLSVGTLWTAMMATWHSLLQLKFSEKRVTGKLATALGSLFTALALFVPTLLVVDTRVAAQANLPAPMFGMEVGLPLIGMLFVVSLGFLYHRITSGRKR